MNGRYVRFGNQRKRQFERVAHGSRLVWAIQRIASVAAAQDKAATVSVRKSRAVAAFSAQNGDAGTENSADCQRFAQCRAADGV